MDPETIKQKIQCSFIVLQIIITVAYLQDKLNFHLMTVLAYTIKYTYNAVAGTLRQPNSEMQGERQE